MAVPPFRPPVPEPLHPLGWQRPPGNLEFRVTQGFYTVNPAFPKVLHRALDLGNTRLGAPITTPAPGKVIAEGWLTEPWSESSTKYGTGNYGGICIAIDHGGGWYSLLAHLSRSIVNEGQQLLDGQLVGNLGDTGSAKVQGGHLHWDLYKGRPTAAMTYAQRVALKVDPWPLLRQNYRLPDTGTAAPEADMRFSGSELHIVDGTPTFTLTVDARFRSAPAIADNTIKVFPAATTVRSAWSVDGQTVNGNDDWLLAAMYTGTAYETGYFHSSVVERVADPLPPVFDCSAEVDAAVKAAVAPLNERIARAKAALG